jgi:plasmid replication initiation protein
MNSKENSKVIVKSNHLIESSYRLTITEQKIMYMIIAMINRNDTDFKEYEFKVQDFIKLLDIKGQNKYTTLKNTIRLLRSRTFTVKYTSDGKEKELITGWIVNGECDEGSLKFTMDPKLKPFLLQLQREFTSMSLNNLMQLRSSYSTRIYELLKQYRSIGERTFSIDELKNLLAIGEHEYKMYSHLKSRVILPAREELKYKTDISFNYEELKSGRKVTGVRFIILPNNSIIETKKDYSEQRSNNSNDSSGNIDVSIDKIQMVKSIIKEDITELEASSILNAANGEIRIIKEKYEIAKVTREIKNLVPWMKDAIKNDYQPPKRKTKTDTFNNFEQRTYDFDKLEKKLLGWEDQDDDVAAE